MDPQLVQFYRQYMQQTASVTLPAGTLLVQTDIQDCLFRYFFDPSRNSYLPPPRYQLRTLKRIIAEIEKSLKQPEEDVGFSNTRIRPKKPAICKFADMLTFSLNSKSQMSSLSD